MFHCEWCASQDLKSFSAFLNLIPNVITNWYAHAVHDVWGMSAVILILCSLQPWRPLAVFWSCLHVCTNTYHPLLSCAGLVIPVYSLVCHKNHSVHVFHVTHLCDCQSSTDESFMMVCYMLTLLKQALLCTRAMQQVLDGVWVITSGCWSALRWQVLLCWSSVNVSFMCKLCSCTVADAYCVHPGPPVIESELIRGYMSCHVAPLPYHDLIQSSACFGRTRSNMMSLLSSCIKMSSLIAYWCMLHACEVQPALLKSCSGYFCDST